MATKKVNINLEISETLDKFVSVFASLNKIAVDEAYTRLLNAGIKDGAPDLNMAILNAAVKEQDTISKIAKYNNLEKIGNLPIEPAYKVEENLAPNVEMTRDDELIARITKEIQDKE